MRLGFGGAPPSGGFDPATNEEDRPIKFNGPDRPVAARAAFGPRGDCVEAEFLAQAQAAAWVRGCRAGHAPCLLGRHGGLAPAQEHAPWSGPS